MSDQHVCARPDSWLRDARTARLLSWLTLGWLTLESGIGLSAGLAAHSASLIGWSLSSLVEALAGIVVIWRFTGSRTLSATAELRARRVVAVSFWVLGPYLVVHVLHDLGSGHRAEESALGVAVTAVSLVTMPFLGAAKRRLGTRLESASTAGEGTQNLLCAWAAGGVLAGLALNAVAGIWWVDPLVALILAGVAVYEGNRTWHGVTCCP
ncbi:cation transporter [Rhizohabitans arisaemae]|uniref:cation transporter n=1 Tax=Rhizohabitans arisaemae TaxID=2720610 RepID=UPI0024B1451B|nr:cation transporter [Rhizohabitans arisaemae]